MHAENSLTRKRPIASDRAAARSGVLAASAIKAILRLDLIFLAEQPVTSFHAGSTMRTLDSFRSCHWAYPGMHQSDNSR